MPGTPTSCEILVFLPAFTATAETAGLSHLMGGYHIQADNVGGWKLGRTIAQHNGPVDQSYFNGTRKELQPQD